MAKPLTAKAIRYAMDSSRKVQVRQWWQPIGVTPRHVGGLGRSFVLQDLHTSRKCRGGRQSGRLDKVQMVPNEYKREDMGCCTLR